MPRKATRLSRAKPDSRPTASVPAMPDAGENSASTLVEMPRRTQGVRLQAHDFPDGGGSGGAESYSRKRLKR